MYVWHLFWPTVLLQGQFWVPGNLGHQFFRSFFTKICLQALSSYLLYDRQMDVYGRFQICTVSSTLSFMNVCRFLIAWQAGCCKQPIFYVYMKCNHEFYAVIDWWPWKVEQGGLEDLRLGKNGVLLCDTWYLCSMLYVSKVIFKNKSGLWLFLKNP